MCFTEVCVVSFQTELKSNEPEVPDENQVS